MSLWEYKVITSGKGGFATPVLLEKFLNDLGRDEWEIIHFQTAPENFLAFTGLARRSTQRDWTLEDAAAAAAKTEAEKLRAEFEAKFKAASSAAAPGAGEERAPSFLEEKSAPDDGFRKPVDTSRDDDPEAQDDDKGDEWDKLTAAEEDELPTFFEAIRPHMRRNQRGPGMAVGVEYLAKKWDQTEDDLKGALVECGFVLPEDEDTKPEYLEYDGDLFWLNVNRRGELWINTKEKPRPVFRSVKAQRIVVEEEPARGHSPAAEKSEPIQRPVEADATAPAETADAAVAGAEAAPAEARNAGGRGQAAAAALPQGPALLNKIRPHMRRNRRGPGGSGSTVFLSRALRISEADLKAAFVGLGLTLPESAADRPVYTEFGDELWWLNVDSRGGVWINGREKQPGETAASAGEASAAEAAGAEAAVVAAPADPAAVPGEVAPETPNVPEASASPAGEPPAAPVAAAAPQQQASPLAPLREWLKETRTGAMSGKLENLAETQGQAADALLAALVGAGLTVPEKPREKPAYLEFGGEVFWLSRNAKGELWLNAKAAKGAKPDEAEGEADGDADADEGESGGDAGEGDGEKKTRRPRAKKKAE
jgi:hypothetical protein